MKRKYLRDSIIEMINNDASYLSFPFKENHRITCRIFEMTCCKYFVFDGHGIGLYIYQFYENSKIDTLKIIGDIEMALRSSWDIYLE